MYKYIADIGDRASALQANRMPSLIVQEMPRGPSLTRFLALTIVFKGAANTAQYGAHFMITRGGPQKALEMDARTDVHLSHSMHSASKLTTSFMGMFLPRIFAPDCRLCSQNGHAVARIFAPASIASCTLLDAMFLANSEL